MDEDVSAVDAEFYFAVDGFLGEEEGIFDEFVFGREAGCGC